MTESIVTQQILDQYGHLPLLARTKNGMIFKQGSREKIASLRGYHLHGLINGEITPLITDWVTGSIGEYGAPGLAPRILPDGEIQILGSRFRFKPYAVGYLTLSPLSFDLLTLLPTGYASGNQYIIEVGIYSYVVTLHEDNKIKVEIHLPEQPPAMAGDYFIIANKVLDTSFYTDRFLEKGEIYDGNLKFNGGIAKDANHNAINITNVVKEIGGVKYLFSGVPVSWLATAAYPVVIDPSVTLQPDDTTAKDAWGLNDIPTENHNDADLWTGVQNSSVRASWLQIPTSSIVDYGAMISADLSLYLNYAQDISISMQTYVSALRRNFGETTVCWDYYSGTSVWSTSPGTNTTSDRYSESASWYTGTGTPATGFKVYSVDTIVSYWLDGSRTNNGFILYRVSTGETTCGVRFGSSGATAAQRPKLDIVYASKQRGAMPIFFN